MATAALGIYVIWAALAFGWRAAVQHRRTGDAGFRGFTGSAGSTERWAGILFFVAMVAGALAPIADLAGIVEPVSWLAPTRVAGLGVLLAVLGVAGTLAAQLSMGDSWRVGVDADERTPLVTAGAFRLARNPIFTMMVLTATGLMLMVPNAVAVAGLAGLLVGLQLQVRFVEEPYLATLHGETYAGYGATVGRFVPGVGRFRASTAS